MNSDFLKRAYTEVDFLKKKLSIECSKEIQTEIDFYELNNLYQFPLLEKDELVQDPLDIVPPRYLPLLYRGELIRNDTSGSTGKCMEIYWRRQDYMRSMYSLWFYRKRFYGINTWDKMCRFSTILQVGSIEEMSRYTRTGLEFSKSDLSEQRLLDIYREMHEFQPVWLLLQPCIAELLCYIKRKHNLPVIPSIKYIEMTGEELTGELREQIKECFQCPVANQYGANEVNSIAYECPEGNMHCMEDNVVVEILDDDGNSLPEGSSGNIYVTTLHNYVMPFIRYGIGDIGYLEKNTCSCGHKGRILHLESGRKDDWILTPDGQKITPYVFVRAVVAVNAVYDKCIFQFQIVQYSYSSFTVILAMDEMIDGIPQCFIENIGQAELRDADYEFIFCEKLFPDINGKRKFFECKIGKQT